MPGSCPNTLSSPEKERQSCGIMEKVHKRLPFFVTKKEKHTEETSIKQKNKNNALTSVEFYKAAERWSSDSQSAVFYHTVYCWFVFVFPASITELELYIQ